MQMIIDNTSHRPVYQQIIDHVKRDVALGRLLRDDKLPTVRQLAAQLIINPNTIAKAYRQLEQDGIIVTKPGSGAYIAQLNSNLSESVRHKIIFDQIELLIIDAIHMQVTQVTLLQWFNQALEKFAFPPSKGLTP